MKGGFDTRSGNLLTTAGIAFAGALVPAAAEAAPDILSALRVTPIVYSLNEGEAKDSRNLKHEPVKIQNLNDIAPNIEKGNLFIKGDGNMSTSQAKTLALWLEKEHPNWVVVIMNTASGESYKGYSRSDAVEWYLSTELPKTWWGESTDKRTGLPNGAFIAIVYDDRQGGLMYKASAVYDQNGVGEDNWINGSALIDLARPGMRDNLNIERAVKEAVGGIDEKLNRIVTRQEAEKTKSKNEAQGAVDTARTTLALLDERVAKFKKDYPNVTGDLSRPDRASIENAIKDAAEHFKNGEFTLAQRIASGAKEKVEPVLKALDFYPTAKKTIESLETDLSKIEKEGLPLSNIKKGRDAVTKAKTEWERGDSSYENSLSSAGTLVRGLPSEILNYKNAKRTLDALETDLSKIEKEGLPLNAIKLTRDALTRAKTTWESGDPLFENQVMEASGMVKALPQEVSFYKDAAKRIQGIEEGLERLKNHRLKNKVSDSIDQIEREIKSAKELWEAGDGKYKDPISRAEMKLSEANAAIKDTESAEQKSKNRLLFLLAIGTLGTGAYFIRRYTQARVSEKEAAKLLAEWKEHLDSKPKLLNDLIEDLDRYVGLSKSAIRYQGKTLEVALETFDNGVNASNWYELALARLDNAQKLVNSGGFVSRKNFDLAVKLLGKEKFDFKAERDVEVGGKGEKDKKRLSARKEDLKTLSGKSFEGLMEDFYAAAKIAEDGKERIKTARLNIDDNLKAIGKTLADLRSLSKALLVQASQDKLFGFPHIEEVTFSVIEKKLKDADALSVDDPITAFEMTEKISQSLEKIAPIFRRIQELRERAIPEIFKSKSDLEGSFISPNWISTGLGEISSSIEKYVGILSADATEECPDFDASIKALHSKVVKALGLRDDLKTLTDKSIVEAKTLVSNTRESLGASLGIDKESILQEKESDPDVFIENALRLSGDLKNALSYGGLSNAEDSLSSANKELIKVKNVVQNTLEAFKSHKENIKELKRRKESLAGLFPKHAAILENLKGNYNEKALLLGEGDLTHPNADGTLLNNMDEATAHLSSAQEAIEDSERLYREGKILEASCAVDASDGLFQLIDHRLDEIRQKEIRINNSTNKTSENVLATEKRLEKLLAEDKNSEVIKTTLDSIRMVSSELDGLKRAIILPKGNPFENERNIKELMKKVSGLESKVSQDKAEYADLIQSIQRGLDQVQKAESRLAQIKGDNVPDSAMILKVEPDLRRLRGEIESLERTRKSGNNLDWYALDDKADKYVEDAVNLLATLKREEEAGREAYEVLMEAKKSVNRLGSWSSSYGVSIDSRAGSTALQNAFAALQSGIYIDALRLAQESHRTASSAWSSAESSERAEEQRAEERRAAERRARAAAAAEAARLADNLRRASQSVTRNYGGGGGGGGGFGSFSSGAKSGGFKVSSGVARGGW